MFVYTFEPDETITLAELVVIVKMMIAAFNHNYNSTISVPENTNDQFEEMLGPALRHFTIDK